MSIFKGHIFAALAGGIIAGAGIYATYHESDCLGTCVGGAELAAAVGAIFGAALGAAMSVLVSVSSRLFGSTRPWQYASIGTIAVLFLWGFGCLFAGDAFLNGTTIFLALSGGVVALAYAAGANGWPFLRQL